MDENSFNKVHKVPVYKFPKIAPEPQIVVPIHPSQRLVNPFELRNMKQGAKKKHTPFNP